MSKAWALVIATREEHVLGEYSQKGNRKLTVETMGTGNKAQGTRYIRMNEFRTATYG